jgi:hypothetical protein
MCSGGIACLALHCRRPPSAAGYVLELSEKHLAELIGEEQLTEIHDHDEEIPE